MRHNQNAKTMPMAKVEEEEFEETEEAKAKETKM